jgi:hypothetical protein
LNRQAAADVPFDKEKAAVIKLRDHRVKDLNDKLKALEVTCISLTFTTL